MKRKDSGQSRFAARRTVRLTAAEEANLRDQAERAGLNVAEYMRRRIFGGRPITAKTDSQTIRELRRLGGLLKHHFAAVRAAGNPRSLEEINATMSAIRQTIETLSNPS